MEFSEIYYRLSIISSVANFLFRKAYDDPDTEPSIISKFWTIRFLTRNPKLNIRFSKFFSFDRHYAHDIEGMLKWYNRFRRICNEYGIQFQDIWNFDETGFTIDVEDMQKIVTRIRNRKIRFYYSDFNYRQHVSSCETINAAGEIIPPIIILEGR
jgi:hypothetical protein